MSLVVGENSYLDVAEAQLYFDDRLYSDAWNDAIPTDQEKSLISATQMMDELCEWYNSKTDPDQDLEFPRGGDTVVPQDIKDAECEIAFEMLRQGFSTFTEQADELKQIKAGSAQIAFYETLTNPNTLVNNVAKALLKKYGECHFGNTSLSVIPVSR